MYMCFRCVSTNLTHTLVVQYILTDAKCALPSTFYVILLTDN